MSRGLLVLAAAALAAPAAPVAPGTEAVVETAKGAFTIRLLPELAPKHVAHFVKTALAGGYDRTTFHRVIPRGIVQGGDPLSRDPARKKLYGTGGLGLLRAEFSDRPMSRGAVAAVLRPSSIHSGGSQFFVVLSDQPSLTGKYTIFGEVTAGLDVLDRIGELPLEGESPRERVEIEAVRIVAPSPVAP